MKSKWLQWTMILGLVPTLAMLGQLPAEEQHKNAQTRYSVTDLGLAADEQGGVNNNGSLDFTAPLADGTIHATFWRHGRKTDLGTLGGPNSSAFLGPNQMGQVVGKAEASNPDPLGEDFCGYGTNHSCRGFVWQKDHMTPLSTLGGNNSWADDINNRGQIVGFAENTTPDPTCQPPQVLQAPPVIWENGQIRELPILDGDSEGSPLAINDNGEAVGASGNCTTPFHAVLWRRDGSIKDIGSLGGTQLNVADGVNDHGHIVGASSLPGDATVHAFLWTEDGGIQDLDTLPGDFGSWAFSINETKQIAGFSNDADGNLRAVLWQDGHIIDLNAVISPAFPLVLIEAYDINNRGEIVGLAVDPNTDEAHAYLAIPCDEGHRGTNGCEAEDAAIVQSQRSERPLVTLSEHSRKLLWQRMGRYRIPPPPGMANQTTELAPEQPLSCPAQSSSRQLEEPASASAATNIGDSVFVHGYCEAITTSKTLNGYCVGPNPFDQRVCRAASDASQCPKGAKAIDPKTISFGKLCVGYVDIARSCAFILR